MSALGPLNYAQRIFELLPIKTGRRTKAVDPAPPSENPIFANYQLAL